MAGEYLTDTNIAIYYLNNQLPDSVASELDKYTLSMSVISRIELLCWRSAKAEELIMIQEFIKNATVHNLNEEIIIQTIELRTTSLQ